ncbi:hypothetical protein R2325_05315 [Mycobacteroides chelonae]|nr:hypothetical protein [Mycobacteroides chelonae]MEC4838285.1 hypothetical protein [Mycobacteroides chelonae]MEC4846008.1 hypothetical protein [Mycobacteroides chelonae]MEC4855152.1 hypothetical protein [Mycobacteroides chelonae]MEC4873851.1 hypothetical protein [Mycobacteroides chelonae]
MTTPDNPDTPTNPVSVPQAPAPAPRSASNTLLVKIAAVVGIVAGAFVILGVTFGLGVLAGSQCGNGGHGGPGGPGEHGRHMMFQRDGQPPMLPPVGRSSSSAVPRSSRRSRPSVRTGATSRRRPRPPRHPHPPRRAPDPGPSRSDCPAPLATLSWDG